MMFGIEKKTGSVTEFVEDLYKSSDKMVLHDKIEGTLVRTLYDQYRMFCMEKDARILSVRKFSEKVKSEYVLDTERCTTRSEIDGGKVEYQLRFVKRE